MNTSFKPPIENCDFKKSISQMFGVNRSLYYTNFGLPGHNGVDFVWRNSPKNGYGEKILAAHDGIVIRLNYETKWKTNGNGIYLQTLDGEYQTIYWHLSEIQVVIGQEVKQGEVIGLAGNTGFVLPQPNSREPFNGTHLHWAIKKVGLNNSYGGSVDPIPFLVKPGDKLPIYWPTNLYYLKNGDYVSWLQTALKLEGFAKDYEPIGHFGMKTLRDVRLLQKKYGIEPAVGFCGPVTRGKLTQRWSDY